MQVHIGIRTLLITWIGWPVKFWKHIIGCSHVKCGKESLRSLAFSVFLCINAHPLISPFLPSSPSLPFTSPAPPLPSLPHFSSPLIHTSPLLHTPASPSQLPSLPHLPFPSSSFPWSNNFRIFMPNLGLQVITLSIFSYWYEDIIMCLSFFTKWNLVSL